MFLQDFSAKIRFLHILARFYTLKTAKNWNQSPWIVYGAIILNFFWWLRSPIRTSDSTAKIIEEKKVFWDTLVMMFVGHFPRPEETDPYDHWLHFPFNIIHQPDHLRADWSSLRAREATRASCSPTCSLSWSTCCDHAMVIVMVIGDGDLLMEALSQHLELIGMAGPLS